MSNAQCVMFDVHPISAWAPPIDDPAHFTAGLERHLGSQLLGPRRPHHPERRRESRRPDLRGSHQNHARTRIMFEKAHLQSFAVTRPDGAGVRRNINDH